MAMAVDEMEAFEDFASDQDFSDFDDEGEETMEEVGTDHVLDLLSEPPSARPPVSLSVVTDHGFSVVATAQQAAKKPYANILEIPDDDPFVDFFQLVKASPQTPSSLQQTKHTTAPSMDEKSGTESGETTSLTSKVICSAEKGDLSHMWGKFSPDKMPARRDFSTLQRVPTNAKPLKVIVTSSHAAQAHQQRRRRRCVWNSEQKELTFRPKINTRYFRRSGIAQLRFRRAVFDDRMQQDIIDRKMRSEKRLEERKQQSEEAETSGRRKSLIAKGSQAILERNGLWDESFSERLQRLMRKDSKPQWEPLHKVRRPSADVDTARACETLYQRGLEKMLRERTEAKTRKKTPQMRPTRRSMAIVRERLHREMNLICSQQDEGFHEDGGSLTSSPPESVSFVEFSCALLFFGLVPHAETPWDGDNHITLLWHAWTTFAEGEGDSRRIDMQALRDILERVILDHPELVRHKSEQARLLSIFRVHYLSRQKTPQGGNSVDKSSQSQATRSKPKRGSTPQYSIHGKVLRDGRRDCDLLAERHDSTKRRLAQMRLEKEAEEIAECTFQPSIRKPTNELDGYVFREATERSSLFDRLYDDAFVRQNTTMVRFFQAKMEAEEKLKKEQRISPSYVNGLTIEERLQRLQVSLSNNALPVNFHKKIAEMRAAYEAKAEVEQEKASRLETPSFPKSKEGRTIVVPFHLQTEERARRDSSRRYNGSHRQSRPSSVELLKVLRRRCQPEISDDHSEHGGKEWTDGEAADIRIDVHVSPWESYPLFVNATDDTVDITSSFAERYDLNASQHQQLLHLVEEKLKQLINF